MFKAICSSPATAVPRLLQQGEFPTSPTHSKAKKKPPQSIGALRTKVRNQVQGMTLSEMRKRAAAAGVSGELVDEVLDSDEPKLALAQLLIDEIPRLHIQKEKPQDGGDRPPAAATAAAAATPLAAAAATPPRQEQQQQQSELHSELEGMTMRELRRTAAGAGLEAFIDDDSEQPRVDLVAMLLRRLPVYLEEVERLERQAAAAGISPELIAEVQAGGGSKRAALESLLGTHRRLSACKVSQMKKKASAAGVEMELVEDALDEHGRPGVLAVLTRHFSLFEIKLRAELELNTLAELTELAASMPLEVGPDVVAAAAASGPGGGGGGGGGSDKAAKAALVDALVPQLVALAELPPEERAERERRAAEAEAAKAEAARAEAARVEAARALEQKVEAERAETERRAFEAAAAAKAKAKAEQEQVAAAKAAAAAAAPARAAAVTVGPAAQLLDGSGRGGGGRAQPAAAGGSSPGNSVAR
eukprot:SAG22_NODE_926_length_6466_cov_55.877179_4_plen_475_part_00